VGQVGDKGLAVDHISLPRAMWKLAPIVVLIVLVLGGIYGGVVTPTEAGAAGAVGALIFTLLKRKLTWTNLGELMVEAGHITVSILFLILAANIYARMLALSGVPQHMSGFIANADLGFLGFIVLYVILIVLLGMILDSVSIMLIVLPLALPVVLNLGGDPIWFGILTVVAVEIGLLTPPLGLTCFVVKSTLDDERITLKQIFIGAFPFVVVMMLVTILLIAVPQLALVFV
jgi:tripartite ATP-independent transporter DctM subunit